MLRSPYLTGRALDGRCALDASWSLTRILAATGRYASPEVPRRLSAYEVVSQGSGTTALGGAALVVNVLVGEGVGGGVTGGAVVANVVVGRGGMGVSEVGGMATWTLDLTRAGAGLVLAFGAADDVEAAVKPQAVGLPGGRMKGRFEPPWAFVPRHPPVRALVLAEVP